MVADTLSADRGFCMIQPFTPQQDNRPMPGAENQRPDRYKVGCAAYIEKWEKLPEGRFFGEVRAVNRVRFEKGLSLQRGYRRVLADYQALPDGKLDEGWHWDRPGTLQALTSYGQAHGLQVKPEQAERFTDLELVNL